jgi:uncharacterized protein (DUF2147 family)
VKKLCIVAALLLATTSADAGNSISFQIDGHQVRIAVPRNCDSLSCISISVPDLSGINLKDLNFGGSRADDDDAPAPAANAAAPKSDPAPVSLPAPAAPQAVNPGTQPAPTTMASTSPAPTPATSNSVAAPAPTTVAPVAPVAAAKPETPVATPAPAPTSPVGVWATEENKGMVRIETCGANLCGYAVKAKPGEHGEKILIDMKPSNTKWVGQIYDPNSGRTYDSNIAMKGTNALRVQGCAFGGMFCGGQTWNRVS